MRESVIERYLVKRVKAAGGICYKFVSPGRRNVPDRIMMFPWKKIVFVETKASKKKASKAQQREHARMGAMGFRVVVLNSKELIDQWFEPWVL